MYRNIKRDLINIMLIIPILNIIIMKFNERCMNLCFYLVINYWTYTET
jgi:hypothetical protein